MMVIQRAPTEPPKSIAGWVREFLLLFVAVTAMAVIVWALWAFHMREHHVFIEQADCGIVVFGNRSTGEKWAFVPDQEQCQIFRVGDRWLIGVNEVGMVRPQRKE